MSPALAGGFFTTSTTWEAHEKKYITVIKSKGMCLEVRESLDWSLNEWTFLGKLFEMGIRWVPTSFLCYSYHRNNWKEALHMILSTQWAFNKCSLHLPLPLFLLCSSCRIMNPLPWGFHDPVPLRFTETQSHLWLSDSFYYTNLTFSGDKGTGVLSLLLAIRDNLQRLGRSVKNQKLPSTNHELGEILIETLSNS